MRIHLRGASIIVFFDKKSIEMNLKICEIRKNIFLRLSQYGFRIRQIKSKIKKAGSGLQALTVVGDGTPSEGSWGYLPPGAGEIEY